LLFREEAFDCNRACNFPSGDGKLRIVYSKGNSPIAFT